MLIYLYRIFGCIDVHELKALLCNELFEREARLCIASDKIQYVFCQIMCISVQPNSDIKDIYTIIYVYIFFQYIRF